MYFDTNNLLENYIKQTENKISVTCSKARRTFSGDFLPRKKKRQTEYTFMTKICFSSS